MVKYLLTLALGVFIAFETSAQPCNNSNSVNFTGSSWISFNLNNNLDNITSAITVEAWIYPTSWAFSSDQGTIVCHHSWTSGPEMGFVLRAGGTGELSFNIGGDSAGVPVSWKEILSSPTALSLNTWTHVAGTFDGTTEKLFINGIEVASQPFTGSIIASNAYPMAIGRLSDAGVGASRYWNGQIDEVRIWNRALTGAELMSKMNNHIDPAAQTGLQGYWRFNEGMGNTVSDSSGSGDNGTLNSASFNTNVPFNTTAVQPLVTQNGSVLISTPASAYQWFMNGNLMPGQTNQTLNLTQLSAYWVQITDAAGCTATSDPFFVTVLGVTELSDGSIMEINQNSESVVISVKNSTGIKTVKVYDVNGRTIVNEDAGNTDNIKISKSSFKQGVYIFDVSTEKSSYRTKLLIQ